MESVTGLEGRGPRPAPWNAAMRGARSAQEMEPSGRRESGRRERRLPPLVWRSLLALLAILAAPSSLAAQPAQPSDAPVQHAPVECGPALVSPLWDAVPMAEREGFSAEPPSDEDVGPPSTPRVMLLELDGAAPTEALLGLDAIGDGTDPGQSAVWAFACRAGRWSSLGQVRFENAAAWDGTIDEVPGLRVLRAEVIPGVDHPFVRIEHVDVRGGVDPRFVRRRFVLAHVTGGALVNALELVVSESVEAGPEREEVFSATRTLVFDRRARPPRYRLTVRTIDSQVGRARRCRTELVFDGRIFAAADPACASR